MYPRSFLCEEAKVKQHTSLKKELCEIGEEAIWESRFTCFFGNFSELLSSKINLGIFTIDDFFQIFVISRSTQILIE